MGVRYLRLSKQPIMNLAKAAESKIVDEQESNHSVLVKERLRYKQVMPRIPSMTGQLPPSYLDLS